MDANMMRARVRGLQRAWDMVTRLVEASQWFTFEPYPDDDYEIAMKAESRELLVRIVTEPSPVRKMFDVSTAHMPSTSPDFGSVRRVRVAEHEYGYIVFVDGAKSDEDVPEWLRPLWAAARDADCILINFDADAERYDAYPSWDW